MDSKKKDTTGDLKALRPSSTIEDYLGAIFTLQRDGERAIGARLAQILQVSPPTVTTTLKRMARDGWIVADERKSVHLTKKGEKAAKDVIRRHMLAEVMLARVLNVAWSDVHDEADTLEHSISTEIEQRMVEEFEDPQVCPHGNPLPGHEDVTACWIPIVDLAKGTRAIVRRVHEQAEENQDLLRFLELKRIVPGIEICVVDHLPFNDTMSIECNGEQVTLGLSIAALIFAEVMM